MSSMTRGHDGRIEAAFAKCKEAGEAAFITFVTAGFPVKEGTKKKNEIIQLLGYIHVPFT
jgi:tryptophan synthase alpha subunit